MRKGSIALPLPIGATCLAAVVLLCASACRAENLDLTKAQSYDWSVKENGAVRNMRALLAPTSDPKAVAEDLRKKFGIRLSTEDPAHTVVVSAGMRAQGVELVVKRATIDRFRHLVELEAWIVTPPPKAAEAEAKNALGKDDAQRQGDWVIGPTRPAKVEKPKAQAAVDTREGNPALFFPVGKLEHGTWWLRVQYIEKTGEREVKRPPATDSFKVKDNRPYAESTRGEKVPESGLQRPDSESVLQGIGR